MEQYIKKSALVAEIKKAIESFFEYNDRIYDEYGNYFYKNADNDYRFYHKIDEDWNWDEKRLSLDEMVYIYLNINTLEVKEVDLDLEKDINKYISDNFFGSQTMGFFANRTKEEPNDQDIALCAKHFFELGLKAQKGE